MEFVQVGPGRRRRFELIAVTQPVTTVKGMIQNRRLRLPSMYERSHCQPESLIYDHFIEKIGLDKKSDRVVYDSPIVQCRTGTLAGRTNASVAFTT